MKQPELGVSISEIRKQRGITQKDLAESCNIDIRTLQRIESGSVTPRTSTLKLLAAALSCDFSALLDEQQVNPATLPQGFLSSIFTSGIFYFLCWLFLSLTQFFSQNDLKGAYVASFGLLIVAVYAIAGVIFYYGFNRLGKHYKNKLLRITSLIIMACIPLFIFTLLLTIEYSFAKQLNTLVVLAMSLNSIFFGIGLFITKSPLTNWYKLAGILQLLVAPFFLINSSITQVMGIWLSIPFLILLLTLVNLEKKESKRIN